MNSWSVLDGMMMFWSIVMVMSSPTGTSNTMLYAPATLT